MREFLDGQTLAALLSAIAAIAAAVAAWSGPLTAARIAEKLRREAARDDEQRRIKMWVFATIMQERAQYYSESAVQAFNSIDVAFNQCPAVREAWAELFAAFDTSSNVPEHARDERLRKLLRAMALELGLSEGLRTDDLARVYYPKALSEETHWRILQRQKALKELQSEELSQNSPAATPGYPPKPS